MTNPPFMTPSSDVPTPEETAAMRAVFCGAWGRCACCFAWVNYHQTAAVIVAEKYEGDEVESGPHAICDKCWAAGYPTDPAKQRKVWEYLFGCESGLLTVYK